MSKLVGGLELNIQYIYMKRNIVKTVDFLHWELHVFYEMAAIHFSVLNSSSRKTDARGLQGNRRAEPEAAPKPGLFFAIM